MHVVTLSFDDGFERSERLLERDETQVLPAGAALDLARTEERV
jgi:hypothetical protein